MRFYFASKLGNLTKVKPLTTISKKPYLIYNLNLTDYYTGKRLKKMRNARNSIPIFIKVL